MTYAVKVRGQWYVARKVNGREFSDDPGRTMWSELRTTACLGFVGEEEKAVELDSQ